LLQLLKLGLQLIQIWWWLLLRYAPSDEDERTQSGASKDPMFHETSLFDLGRLMKGWVGRI
jgi:hypothetical protein